MHTEAEIRETLAYLEAMPRDRQLVWVKGRLVCPSEAATHFREKIDQIVRRAQTLVAQIDRINRMISRRLAETGIQ